MKRLMLPLIIIFIFLSGTSSLRAQYTDDIPKNRPFFDKKTVSWGYYFGLNFYDFKIDYDQEYEHIIQESNPGFQVGLVGNYNLNENVSFRSEPGVFFTNRKLIFRNLTTASDSIREKK